MVNIYPQLIIRIGGGVWTVDKDDASNDTPCCISSRCALIGVLREKLRERLQKFNELPAEQQQALKNLYNRLHQLPPERQEAVRGAVGRFSEQSPQRQRAMREELQNMANLSEQERQARIGSSEFRKKFNRKEQGIVRDMAPLLPAQ